MQTAKINNVNRKPIPNVNNSFTKKRGSSRATATAIVPTYTTDADVQSADIYTGRRSRLYGVGYATLAAFQRRRRSDVVRSPAPPLSAECLVMRRLIVLIRADARRRRTDVKLAGVRRRYVAVPSSYKHHARATIEHLFRRALPRRRRTAPLSSLSRLQSESERIHELLRRRTDVDWGRPAAVAHTMSTSVWFPRPSCSTASATAENLINLVDWTMRGQRFPALR